MFYLNIGSKTVLMVGYSMAKERHHVWHTDKGLVFTFGSQGSKLAAASSAGLTILIAMRNCTRR